MEGSLDDLVHHLLNDIALCGERGASTDEVLHYLAEYCKNSSLRRENSTITWNVDQVFQSQVWRWLTKHPDIRVGRDGKDSKAKQWSLGAVQAYNEKLNSKSAEQATGAGRESLPVECRERSCIPVKEHGNDGDLDDHVPAERVPGSNPEMAHDGATLHQGKNDLVASIHARPDKEGSSTKSKDPTPLLPSGKTIRDPLKVSSIESTDTKEKSPIKVYACEDRLWWAVAGHGPDREKIPRTSFTCLSIIASFREKGVPQPELARLSGQDNRSVPRRTDVLQEQGYIEKLSTFFDGHRTTHCILRRFTKDRSLGENFETILGASWHQAAGDSDSKTSNSIYLGMVRHRDRIEEMFEHLQQNPIYAWYDLKKEMASTKRSEGVVTDRYLSKVLAVAVRRWEHYKVVRRMKAVPSSAPVESKLRQCVKLIRPPENKDWDQFYMFENLNKCINQPAGDTDAESDNVDEVDTAHGVENASDDDGPATFGAPTPFWRPSQTFGNFVYDVISLGGTDGINTMMLKDLAFGPFFEKPLEHGLNRLEESWQLSQPLHLRHLAILRDIASTSKVANYVHYTYPNFKSKVEKGGDVTWEAVMTIKLGKANDVPNMNAVADLDEFGFPILDATKFVGKKRYATLAQCVEAAYRVPFRLKGQDPMVIDLPNGKQDVSWSCNPFMKRARSRLPKPEASATVDENGEPIPYIERRGGFRIPKPRSELHYFPSRFAHTRLVIGPSSSSGKPTLITPRNSLLTNLFVSSSGVSGWHDKNKPGPPKPRGRPPKKAGKLRGKSKLSKAMVNPEITTTISNQEGPGLDSRTRKRNIETAELGELSINSKRKRQEMHSDLGYLPSTHAHTTFIFQPRSDGGTVTLGQRKVLPSRILPARIPRIKPQKPREPELMSYHEQSIAIEREEPGCYIGDLAKMRRTKGRGRHLNSRLAIFRSSRLQNLDWFLHGHSSAVVNESSTLEDSQRQKITGLNAQHQPQPSYSQPSYSQPSYSQPSYSQPSYSQPSELTNQTTPPRQNTQAAYGWDNHLGLSQQAVTSLPTLPSDSSGIDLAIDNNPYTSPYTTSSTAAHLPTNTTTATPVVCFQSYGTATVPVTHSSPYAPTALPVTYPTPYAPTSASHVSQGDNHMTSSVAVRQGFQQFPYPPPSTHASRINLSASTPKAILKRRHSLALQEKPVPGSDGDSNTAAPAPPKRRKVGRPSKGFSANRSTRKESAQPLILKGLNPSRFQQIIQAAKAAKSSGSAPNPRNEVSEVGEELISNANPILSHNLREEAQSSPRSQEVDSDSTPLVTDSDLVITRSELIKDAGKESSVAAPDAQSVSREDSVSEPATMDAVDDKSRTPEPGAREVARPFLGQKIIQPGGSTAVMRRKIIMDILDEAEGLYPGGTELWFPFMAAWGAKGIASKPDDRTIRSAVKALVDTGKVRLLTFSFSNKKGSMIQKKIITLMSLAPSDPKVAELKRRMSEKYPLSYFPPKPELSSALKRELHGQGIVDKLAEEESLPTLQEVDRKRTEERAIKERLEREKKEQKAIRQYEADQRRKTYLKRYNTAKRLGTLQNKSNPEAPRVPEQLLKWSAMPLGPWVPWDGAHSTARYDLASREAELAKLRESMSDAQRYEMLDRMAPPKVDEETRDDESLSRRSSPSPSLRTQPQGEGVPGQNEKKIVAVDVGKESSKGREEKQDSPPKSQDQKPKKKSITTIEVMPKDLDEILSQCPPQSLPSANDSIPDITKFNSIVDKVFCWERGTVLASTVDRNNHYFINHPFPGIQNAVSYPRQDSYAFFNAYQSQQDIMAALAGTKIPKHMRTKYHPQQLPKPTQPSKIVPREGKVPKDKDVPKRKKQKRSRSSLTNDSKAVQRLTVLKERVAKLKPVELDPSSGRSYTKLRLRGPASLRYLSASEERRIMLAIIVVRSLTGGLDKLIDWQLIAQIFKDDYEELFIHRKWTYMMQKHRSHVNKLQDKFQDLFAKAYEDDLVPPIDFDHLEEYDWDEVIRWTDKHLDSSFSSSEMVNDDVNLPSQRSDLDDMFDLQAPVSQDKNAEYFELQGPMTIPRRHVMAHAEPAATCIASPGNQRSLDTQPFSISNALDNVTIAKSWVKANIITPVNTYSSDFASSKFSLLPDSAIQSGLKALFDSKQITQDIKTAYELAGAYIARLNRNVSVSMLKDAASYKVYLDEVFRRGEEVLAQQTARDGHCVVMINLVVRRMIDLRAVNPPMTKWGLLEKGQYETRRMNKKQKLLFEMQIHQTDKYEFGCPLSLPLPEPPLKPEQRTVEHVRPIYASYPDSDSVGTVDAQMMENLGSSQEMSLSRSTMLKVAYRKATRKDPIPMWYDINGALVPKLWETCISAVLSTVVFRPGIPLSTLCIGLKDTLEQFEVEGVVRWLVDAGAAKWLTENTGEVREDINEDRSIGLEKGWWAVLWENVETEKFGKERHVESERLTAKAALTRTVEPVVEDVEMGGI